MKRLSIEPNEDEFEAFVDCLTQDGFSPVVRRAMRAVHELLGLEFTPPKTDEARGAFALGLRFGQATKGEIFVRPGANSIFYLKIERGVEPIETGGKGRRGVRSRLYLEAGMIGDVTDARHLESFCDCLIARIKAARPGAAKDCEFSFLRWANKGFDKLTSDPQTATATVTKDEKPLALALRDKGVRSVLITVKAAGGMLAKDISNAAGRGSEEIVKGLLEKNLLERELVVICRKTSQQVNRLKSQAVLEEIDQRGVRCSCGRKLSEERIEELLTPSETGKRLLDGSRWMAISLVESFERLGIPETRIVIGFQEGAEEVDAFADIDGHLVMVELKDKEFSLGHAYRVSGRIGIYKPNHAVIISTDHVAPDVRDFFKRIEPKARVWYVDGLENVTNVLEKVVDEIRALRAVEVLKEFNSRPSMNLDVADLVARKLGLTMPEQKEMPGIGPLDVWGQE